MSRVALACLLAPLAAACGYREVAPPAAPSPRAPQLGDAPAKAPAEDQSRIVFDVEGEHASVYRQLEMAQPADRLPDRSRVVAFDRYELLCVTPCTADVRRGAHVFRFESLGDGERRSDALVTAPAEPTLVRHALGRVERPSVPYYAATFVTGLGGALMAFGVFELVVGSAQDGNIQKNGQPYDGGESVRAGLITVGIGGGAMLLGGLGMFLLRPERQQGTTIQTYVTDTPAMRREPDKERARP